MKVFITSLKNADNRLHEEASFHVLVCVLKVFP